MQRLEEIQQVAHAATKHALKKLPRRLTQHAPDMVQEAVIALLKAEPKYDPSQGPFARFGFHVALHAALRHLNTFRAVVVGPRPDRGGVPRDDDPIDAIAMKLIRTASPPTLLPDDAVDRARVALRIRAAIRRLDDSRGKQGARVLLDDRAPMEVRRKGQRMKEVRYAVKNTTRRAQRSTTLRALWQEIQP